MAGERKQALRQASANAPQRATAGSAAVNVCSSVLPGSQADATDVPSGPRDNMYPVRVPASDNAALSNASAEICPSTSLTRGRSPIASDNVGGASSSIFANWRTSSAGSDDPSNSSQLIANEAASLDHVLVEEKGDKGADRTAARVRQETSSDCSILEESQDGPATSAPDTLIEASVPAITDSKASFELWLIGALVLIAWLSATLAWSQLP